jgi:hypothetical protein
MYYGSRKLTRGSVQFASLIGRPKFVAERGKEVAVRFAANGGFFVRAAYTVVLGGGDELKS